MSHALGNQEPQLLSNPLELSGFEELISCINKSETNDLKRQMMLVKLQVRRRLSVAHRRVISSPGLPGVLVRLWPFLSSLAPRINGAAIFDWPER